jgi:predicted nicotinamide N-methyase
MARAGGGRGDPRDGTPRDGPGGRDQHGGRTPRDDTPRDLPRSHRRAFVARHTRLREVDGVRGVRLHLADDVETLWPATEAALGIDGAPIPFWAFAWAGGLALARYVLEVPQAVADRRVLDFATGSGLVAIAAARAGAAEVLAADIDPFAEVAVALNARANGVHVGYTGHDLLDGPPPDVDVLLAADTWYEGPLAERVLPWLRAAAARGTAVLVGDPGRRYLPDPAAAGLTELARYEVRTTTVLEDHETVTSRVFRLA